MSGLEALLITSIEGDIPINKYFPTDYNNQNNITELLIIAEFFKKCGKGSLQHKNKIFYYRTYIPTMPKQDGNSVSNESYSDFFIYNYDTNRKKYFLIFLCDLSYKENNINNLTNGIFVILDNKAFEGHEIKAESCHKINTLFFQYKNLQPKVGKLNDLYIINDSQFPSIDSSTSGNKSQGTNKDQESNKSQETKKKKKRIDSRMVLPKLKKTKSTVSIDIDDITGVQDTTETDLSIMFKKDLDKELYLPKINKWKNIKIINLIICIIFFAIMLTLFILFIR